MGSACRKNLFALLGVITLIGATFGLEAMGDLCRGHTRTCTNFSCTTGSSHFFRPSTTTCHTPGYVSHGRVIFEEDLQDVQGTLLALLNNDLDLDNFFEISGRTGDPKARLIFDHHGNIFRVFLREVHNYHGKRFFNGKYYRAKGKVFQEYGHKRLVGTHDGAFLDVVDTFHRNRQTFVTAVRDAKNRNDFINALRDLRTVDAVLARARRNRPRGILKISLGDSVWDDKLGYDKKKLLTSTLNFWLNSMNIHSKRLIKVGNYADKMILNTQRPLFFMNDRQLDIITRDYPYACGRKNFEYRFDWLAQNSTDSDKYYEFMNLSNDFEQLAFDFGVDWKADRLSKRAKGKTSVIRGRPHESEVAPGQFRLISWETQKDGQQFHRSYDTQTDKVGFRHRKLYNPLFTRPEALTFNAMEMIGHLPNGFLWFYLSNAAGVRQGFAPPHIAHGSADPTTREKGFGPGVIGTAFSCLNCHNVGFRTQNSPNSNDRYKFEILNKIGFKTDQYAPNSKTRRNSQEQSLKFFAKLIKSGSYLPQKKGKKNQLADPIVWTKDVRTPAWAKDFVAPINLVGKLVHKYNQPLTWEQVAKELYLTGPNAVNAAKAIVPKAAFVDGKNYMTREEFENGFCVWLSKAQKLGNYRGPAEPVRLGYNRTDYVPKHYPQRYPTSHHPYRPHVVHPQRGRVHVCGAGKGC